MAQDRFAEGTVTVLFTDVEGSTGLGERAGDISARRILRAHDDLIRVRVEEHGGREIKSLGDGFMVAFPSARRAVECAVAIQRALHEVSRGSADDALRVRMGLNAGEAIHEGGDLFGSAVSAAARISDKARGGEILVSEVVKALIGTHGDLDFKDRGRVRLKGFEDRWRLYEVVWQQGSEGAPGSDRTPFVGRQEERAALRKHLERLAQGRGGLVMIGGEPGVGKTRIAEEIALEAQARDFRALTGRCYEMDSPPPYLPFIELLEAASREVDKETFRIALGDAAGEVAKVMPQLRNMYSDLPPPLDLPPEQERRYLFNSISEFVTRAAATTPLVVVLDDLHWADESSLLLLQHIAQGLEETGVLILGTYRDVELDAERPLAAALDNLVRRRLAHRMTLKRLSLEGVEAMLTKLGGQAPPDVLVDAIFKETDGNAFFVEEVYRHLLEEGRLFGSDGRWRADLSIEELEVPEGVRLVIGRRLQRVAEPTRKALTVAAVIGRTFPFDLLEMVGEVEGDELLDAVDEAQQSHLVVPAGGSAEPHFSFVHELIRQTLLAQVAAPRRQRLHLRVGEAMERFYAGRESDRAVELAHHFYQAGAAADPATTVRYMTLAGEGALNAAAFEDALRFFKEAIALLDESAEEERAALDVKLGSALRSLGRLDEGLAEWRRALDFYLARGDKEKVAAIAVESAVQVGWAGRWEEAVEMAALGLQAVGEGFAPERCRLLGIGGLALSWAGQYEIAKSMIEEALALAPTLEDETQLGAALTAKSAHSYAYVHLDDAVGAGREACDILRRQGDLWTLVTALGFLAFSLLFLYRLEEAEEVVAELGPLAYKLGHGGGMMFAHRMSSISTHIRDPDPERLEQGAYEDHALCEKHQLPWTAQSYILLGRAEFCKGELEDAWKHLELGVAQDPPGALYGWGLGQLFLYRALADPPAARAMVDVVMADLPEPGAPATMGRWIRALYAAEGFAVMGDEVRCKELYPTVSELLESGILARFDGAVVPAVAGLVAAVAGDLEMADRHLRAAESTAEMYPDSVERHDTRRMRAQMLLRRDGPGDRAEARRLLEEAAAFYRTRGFIMNERIVDDLLAGVPA
ncbi:MAG: AAA family ATPase [Actinomycetota bacterium]